MYLIAIIALIVLGLLFFLYRMKNNKSVNKTDQPNQPSQPSQQNQLDMSDKSGKLSEEEMKQNIQKILSYDIDDEDDIIKQLPNMTVEEMSKYADLITKKNYEKQEFLDSVIREDIVEKIKEMVSDENIKNVMINPTMFGNLAFISLNTNDPYKSRANEALNIIKELL